MATSWSPAPRAVRCWRGSASRASWCRLQGHSDDSVSLLLDTGAVFTGDLTHPMLVTEETATVVSRSWQRLRELGATTVYAGHGPVRPMPAAE